jgi:predicted nucleic acid-binding protein
MSGGERAGAGRFTLDTNVLVYCVDSAAGPRRETARRVVEAAARRDCRLTLQAVSEFYAAATRKGMMPRSEAAAQANDWLDLFPAIAASPGAVRAALAAAATGRAAYWDALLLATAAEGGCGAVLTEDLADGATLEGVRVVNPFGDDGRRLTAAAAELLGLGA